MKKVIRLTESDLHNLIAEGVKNALNEVGNTPEGQNLLGRHDAVAKQRGYTNYGNKNFQDAQNQGMSAQDYYNRMNNRGIYNSYLSGMDDQLNNRDAERQQQAENEKQEAQQQLIDYLQNTQYKCQYCGTLNSLSEPVCRRCGTDGPLSLIEKVSGTTLNLPQNAQPLKQYQRNRNFSQQQRQASFGRRPQ